MLVEGSELVPLLRLMAELRLDVPEIACMRHPSRRGARNIALGWHPPVHVAHPARSLERKQLLKHRT